MIDDRNLFLLIHSPLVGPLTWSLVADRMRQRGLNVLVPVLRDSPASKEPYWKQHVESVSSVGASISLDMPITLIAHSGAGPLLPVIRRSIPNPVHAYVFVDAGVPRNAATRLELMKLEDNEWANGFQQELENGIRFPSWNMDDLQEVLPDETLRRQMVAELHPRGLDFFTEPIPVFYGWPDAPCVYIQFSDSYEWDAIRAREAGWPMYKMQAGHFHMLVDPQEVTELIVKAVDEL